MSRSLVFGSLFSGVGGFDMGLEAAGMKPAWQVEVEPQAASVLRYRWPGVDLHADVRNVGRSNLARVDLICGGFPCQDLSVAGKRAGLAGERSGLFHEFMRIVDELAPTWVLIENVPGLLSSNGGRDMGTVLGVLGGLGYGWAYRCLDTQYFGPPQRRLRVFIVGRAGGFCPPEVLLESEGLPWNPAPRREAREGFAPGAGAGVAGSCSVKWAKGTGGSAGDEVQNLVAGTLDARTEAGGFPGTDGACAGHVVAHTLRGEGADASEDGTGRGTPLVVGFQQDVFCEPHGVAPALAHSSCTHKSHHQPKVLAFNWQSGGDCRQNPQEDVTDGLHVGQVPAVLAGATSPHFSAVRDATGEAPGAQHRPRTDVGAIPRRLTPRECERLQGWPDDWTRWGTKPDGKVVEIADSPRYRMAGNGVSKPPAEWIGRRILNHSSITTEGNTDER